MTESDPNTLLVVDDSTLDHQLIKSLLSSIKQLQLVFVDDGVKALKAIEQKRPDLILTDLVMPDMDGLELVQKVRSWYPNIPIVLMTAHGSEDAAMRALRAGAANYIPKKELAQDLVETVQSILGMADVDRRRRRLMSCLQRRETFYRLDNDPNQIASLIELVQEELDGMGMLDRTGRIRVSVAIQEALTNAFYHGNLEISSDLRQDDERNFYREAEARRCQQPYASRSIHVLVQLDRQEVKFTITDEGPGFDISRFNRAVESEDLLRIGGRGLLLIRAFMDEVTFSQDGRTISLVKRFSLTSV